MDRVEFVCPECRKTIFAPPSLAGRAAPCPKCGVHIPAWPAPAFSPASTLPSSPTPPPIPPAINYQPDGEDHFPYRRDSSITTGPVVEFFTFRLMVTPILIQIAFWIGTMFCLIVGFWLIAESFEQPVRSTISSEVQGAHRESRSFSPWMFLAGLCILANGPLSLRIFCELVIVIFKIHSELKVANDRK